MTIKYCIPKLTKNTPAIIEQMKQSNLAVVWEKSKKLKTANNQL